MDTNIYYSLLLALSFLILFGSAELLYHYFHIRAEFTRKMVHLLTGVITLLFPVLLTSHWYVLLLCASFCLILILSIKFKFLHSINNIDRVSRGSISYPIAVYSCFLVYTFFNNYIFFYLPVLILAISDPLAALIGRKYPKGKYIFFKEQKTVVGSSAFLLSALIISVVLFKNFTPLGYAVIFLISFGVASLTTIAEAVAQKGYDNLTIPAVATCALIVARYVVVY